MRAAGACIAASPPAPRHAGQADGPTIRRAGPPAASAGWDVVTAAVGATTTARGIGADVGCEGRVECEGECGEH